MSSVPPALTTEASRLADACLDHLVAHPEELLAFMQHAGLDGAALQRAVGSPRLSLGLIDHFGANEALLLALCANTGTRPEAFMRVWHALNPAG